MRSTSLLPAMARRYPGAHITWITKAPALLKHVEQIDRLLTLDSEDLLKLAALEFDVALVIDKSLVAEGLLRQTRVKEVRGFVTEPTHGAIVAASVAADELWQLGLSDHAKFFVNQKTEQQLVHEALELGPFTRDEYIVSFSDEEKSLRDVRRTLWSRGQAPIIGINTGCSGVLPHKKLSIEGHRQLLQLLQQHPVLSLSPVVLLGGREDSERNEAIAPDHSVILSPSTRGLRDGLVSVAACDLVVSGDSLGMHMAIGLGKWVVAWFGPSCAQEIDLYGRGRKILTQAPCSPCWKRDCHKAIMCYDQVDFAHVIGALEEGLQWHISSSKPPSPAISFSPSPY